MRKKKLELFNNDAKTLSINQKSKKKNGDYTYMKIYKLFIR